MWCHHYMLWTIRWLPIVLRSHARWGWWKTAVLFDILRRQHEHKKQNWRWIFSRFLRWNFVKFGRLVVNILLQSELVFQFFCSGKRYKFENVAKTAFTNPTFFVLKIRIPLEVVWCKNFGRFHRRKFMKITNKAMKTVKNAFVWAFII